MYLLTICSTLVLLLAGCAQTASMPPDLKNRSENAGVVFATNLEQKAYLDGVRSLLTDASATREHVQGTQRIVLQRSYLSAFGQPCRLFSVTNDQEHENLIACRDQSDKWTVSSALTSTDSIFTGAQ